MEVRGGLCSLQHAMGARGGWLWRRAAMRVAILNEGGTVSAQHSGMDEPCS